MNIFPDAGQRKRMMKSSLPLLVAFAWFPIIGMAVIAVAGKPLAALVGWQATLGVAGFISLLLALFFVVLFRRTGQKIGGDNQ